MLSVKCSVPECSNVSGENKTFWRAPKQEAIRKQWFQVLGVPVTVKSALICEDHFQVEDQHQSYSDEEHSYSRPGDSETPANGKHKRRKSGQHPSETNHRTKSLAESNSDRRSTYSATSSDEVENSEERWPSGSSPTGNGSCSDDSNDSQALVIKTEPEDDDRHMEETPEEPPQICEELVSYEMLENHMKVEANSIKLEEVLSLPFLEILDQPESSYRFRYKRESNKPHGPLKGRLHAHKGPRISYGPKVKLCNFHGKEAILRVWLFCGPDPSPHQLVSSCKVMSTSASVSEETLLYEPHQISVSEENNYTVSFDKLNILHVVCGDIDYQKRYYYKKHFAMSNSFLPPTNLPPFDQALIKDEIKRKEKDIASLYIEAFEKTDKGYRKICEVFSESIKNKKSPKTNDLKILKQSHEEGSCRGNQQVLIFTEKLIKDICVEFFEEDEDGEITWSSKASFKENDIHKQVAISFWTPPYKDLHISTPVPVFFRLVRTTDGATSHNRTYMYLPADCSCSAPSRQSPGSRKRECMPPSEVLKSEKGIQVSFIYDAHGNLLSRDGLVPSKKVVRYTHLPIQINSRYSTVDPNTMAKLRIPHLVPLKKGRYSPPPYLPPSS